MDSTLETEQPRLVVIGGPNGAGKTTCSPSVLSDRLGIESYVNADEIAFPRPQARAVSDLEAGRRLLVTLRELIHRRVDFAFEATLAARSLRRLLDGARTNGYTIHVVFVWLRSPELAVSRVRHRASAGGHSVPEEVIRRRYDRSLANFWSVYRPVADSWILCDNSGSELVIVATGTAQRVDIIHKPHLYDEIAQRAAGR